MLHRAFVRGTRSRKGRREKLSFRQNVVVPALAWQRKEAGQFERLGPWHVCRPQCFRSNFTSASHGGTWCFDRAADNSGPMAEPSRSQPSLPLKAVSKGSHNGSQNGDDTVAKPSRLKQLQAKTGLDVVKLVLMFKFVMPAL